MCLSTSTFQSVARKHSGRKLSTSEHLSGGENSKGAGFTGRPGLGFLLLVFSEPRGRDGNNHPTSLSSERFGTTADVCTAVL